MEQDTTLQLPVVKVIGAFHSSLFTHKLEK